MARIIKNVVKRCVSCNAQLANFIGYIPEKGEACLKCFFENAVNAHPAIPAEIRQGQFGALHGWLQDNIYQHGSKFTASELVERVTGGPMRIEPYIRYLRSKYGELYKL